MGLDQYLQAEIYVSGYDFSEKKENYTHLVNLMGVAGLVDKDTPFATVSVTVAYWRKANHIHAWFVENVQSGTDDCSSYDVSVEQLSELRDVCKQVLARTKLSPGLIKNGEAMTDEGWSPIPEEGGMVVDSSAAEELLPTASGFFFGSTDYDEYYIRDLTHTVDQITRVINNLPEGANLQYESSW